MKNALERKFLSLAGEINVHYYLDIIERLSFKYLLFTIVMIILPTNPAGLDRDHSPRAPTTSVQEAQTFCPKKLLDILTKSSYLRESGWQIIFYQFFSRVELPELLMEYRTGI